MNPAGEGDLVEQDLCALRRLLIPVLAGAIVTGIAGAHQISRPRMSAIVRGIPPSCRTRLQSAMSQIDSPPSAPPRQWRTGREPPLCGVMLHSARPATLSAR